MKHKFIRLYMDIALRVAEMSYAKRLKVGTIIVKDDAIISLGYNGTPSGWDNCCEYEERCWRMGYTFPVNEEAKEEPLSIVLKTKPEVIHSEINAIGKLAKLGMSGKDAVLFCTHAPCVECAKAIHVAGIKLVYYNEDYRDKNGIDFLTSCGIKVVGPVTDMPI